MRFIKPSKINNFIVKTLLTGGIILIAGFAGGSEYDLYRNAVDAMNEGKYTDAIGMFELVLESPGSRSCHASSLNNIGFCYGKINNFEKALEAYRRAANSDDPLSQEQGLYSEVFLWVRNSNWEKAIEVGKKYIASFPESENMDQIYLQVAEAYESLTRTLEAEEYFKKILDEFPKSSLARHAVFKLHPKKKQGLEVEEYNDILKYNKSDHLYFQRGMAYYNKRDYAKAIKDYSRWIQSNSANVDAYPR